MQVCVLENADVLITLRFWQHQIRLVAELTRSGKEDASIGTEQGDNRGRKPNAYTAFASCESGGEKEEDARRERHVLEPQTTTSGEPAPEGASRSEEHCDGDDADLLKRAHALCRRRKEDSGENMPSRRVNLYLCPPSFYLLDPISQGH